MDKDVARHIIRAAFRCSGELEELLPVLKTRCSPDEYKAFAIEIAKVIDCVGVALINRVLSIHPDLEAEIEANLARSGRAM
jgi:hypothetical protein